MNHATSCSAVEQGFVRCLQTNDTESLKRLLLNTLQLETLKSSIITYAAMDPLPLLHVSCFHGSTSFVDVMLRYGFDPDIKASKGKQETPLSMLVRKAETTTDDEETHRQTLEMIQLLLSHGANPSCVDLLQWKPIHSTQNKTIMKMLLKAGEILDSRGGAMEQTPLMLACKKGNKELVAWLLKNHSNPNVCDKLGFFPIHYAMGNEFVTKLLITVGKQDINKRANNSEGYTPLHFCCERETKGIQGKTNLLIMFSANADLKTLHSHQTAEDLTECHKYLFKLYRKRKDFPNTTVTEALTPLEDDDVYVETQFNKYLINYDYIDNLTREDKRKSISHMILDDYMD